MSEEQGQQFEQMRRRKCAFYCFVAVVLVFVVLVAIMLVVMLKVDDNDEPPSISPSAMPSSSPTSNLFTDFLDSLRTHITTPPDLGADPNAPQYMAAKWLADYDTYQESLSIEDPKTLQRYALASLYFATGGNNWRLCGTNSQSCYDTTWLTSTDECGWSFLECEESVVTKISFCK
jgi:hypothetical protein